MYCPGQRGGDGGLGCRQQDNERLDENAGQNAERPLERWKDRHGERERWTRWTMEEMEIRSADEAAVDAALLVSVSVSDFITTQQPDTSLLLSPPSLMHTVCLPV